MESGLNRLYEQKIKKLAEQREFSNKMNAIVRELSNNSHIVKKNLEVAISVSKRPGYFHYYEPDPKIRELEQSKVLENLVAAIQRVGRDIEQLDREIAQIRANERNSGEAANEVRSLGEWFSVYGRPSVDPEASDRISTFVSSQKVYGGTGHHKAFRSQSTVMKRGRCTI